MLCIWVGVRSEEKRMVVKGNYLLLLRKAPRLVVFLPGILIGGCNFKVAEHDPGVGSAVLQ